ACTMERAFERMKQVSGTLLTKSDELYTYYTAETNPACDDLSPYVTSANGLESIHDNAVFDSTNNRMRDLYNNGKRLKAENRALQIKSCPLLY
ncbi:MAG: hypothetical protein KJ709_08540, partial [Nanoarchaeota archaeon]|nr:hypothetical protein [Nanoarchaeota archaeon]